MTSTIRTRRLELVPGTSALLEAELSGREALALELGLTVPEGWPPPLYDRDAIRWMLDRLAEDDGYRAWGFRYFVLTDEGSPRAVGAGGYKGPPADGAVEIGYSILPKYQRRGLASEATEGLVSHAFAAPAVTRVIAETLEDLRPSIGVLEKCGFRLVGEGSEPGVVRYERTRGETA